MKILLKMKEGKLFLSWISNCFRILNKHISIPWNLRNIMMIRKNRKKEGFS